MISSQKQHAQAAPATPEQFVSLNAVVFFFLSIVGILFIISGGIAHIYTDAGWLLPFALFGCLAPLIYISLGHQPSAITDRRRFVWATIACSMVVVGMFARQIIIRPLRGIPTGIYDGAVQSEVAADFLLHGKNPYGADYRGTSYAVVNKPVIGNLTDNEVWYHYIYPPLNFLVYLPIRLVSNVFGPLADYRLITVSALCILTWLLTRQVPTWSQKTTVVLLTLGNVLLWGYAVIGSNDLLVVLFIVGSTILLQRQRWWWSGVLFGLALAAKQTAWVVSPLWIWWIWQTTRRSTSGRQIFYHVLGGAAVSVGALYLPFILWNPSAIFTDLVRYAGGAISNTYPIAGMTFLQYLRVLGIIDSPYTVIPVYVFQLIVGIPVLLLTASWIRSNTHPSRWLAGAAVLTLSVMLVSRFFNNNFLQIPMVLLITAYLLQHQESKTVIEQST